MPVLLLLAILCLNCQNVRANDIGLLLAEVSASAQHLHPGNLYPVTVMCNHRLEFITKPDEENIRSMHLFRNNINCTLQDVTYKPESGFTVNQGWIHRDIMRGRLQLRTLETIAESVPLGVDLDPIQHINNAAYRVRGRSEHIKFCLKFFGYYEFIVIEYKPYIICNEVTMWFRPVDTTTFPTPFNLQQIFSRIHQH